MKPRLLDTSKTLSQLVSDESQGLGVLMDVTSCKVTEERNGAYTAEMDVSVDDPHFSDIVLNGVVALITKPRGTEQMFRIRKISKPMKGIVTVYLNHVTYDLAKTSVTPFTATGAALALSGIKSHMTGGSAFSFSTNLTNTTSAFKNEIPQSARALFGGQQGSMLDVFGGEYEWDNLTVRLLAHRGSDNGVRIAYGKNLTDLRQDENIESMYTAVMPYVRMSGQDAILGDLQTIIQTAEPKILNLDLTEEFDANTTPTKAQINQKAQQYIQNNDLATPKVNLEVSFVNLADTQEYKDIVALEEVNLCDTVTIEFPKLGVDATAKVIKTEFDVLAERYTSIEIGDAKSSLARTVNQITEQVKEKVSSSFMDAAIENATNLITGGLGGYVVISKNAAGEPEEILIMNTADKATATQVIRINKNGIGFGTSYNGPFETAWTIDGKFVADYIASGTINAIDIVGSLIRGATIVFGTDTAKTVTASGDSSGINFEGTGRVRYRTVGSFNAYNYSDTTYTTQYNHLAMGKYTNSSSQNYTSAELYNYDLDGRSANYIDMQYLNNATNIWLTNKLNNITRNNMTLNATATNSQYELINYDNTGTMGNHVKMYINSTNSAMTFTNNFGGKTNNGLALNHLIVSSDQYATVNLYNNTVDGYLCNRLYMTSFRGNPYIEMSSLEPISESYADANVKTRFVANNNAIRMEVKDGAYISASVSDGTLGAKTEGSAYVLRWVTFYDRDGIFHRVLGPQ